MIARLIELAGLFLKLGTIGFGGPAVHIAVMEGEVVERRKWMTREEFLKLIAATHLIPGPNSTELAIFIGFHRAGLAGLVVAGACFIFPAVFVTGLIAWGYQRYGMLPDVQVFLNGIKPAVLAVIISAGWRLGREAMGSWQLALMGTSVFIASLWGGDPVVVLIVASFLGTVWLGKGAANGAGAARHESDKAALMPGVFPANLVPVFSANVAAAAGGVGMASSSPSLWALGLYFLKIGAVLYGSGYVLVAYLRGGLLPGGPLAGLTEAQLLDAVAIGQFTPGPILSTATFVGYLVARWPGATVATVGIFLPSFLFVALVGPLLPRLRRWPWAAAFFDSATAASLGLLAAVTVPLGVAALGNWPSWLIGVAAGVAIVRWNLAPAWLVLGGALANWLLSLTPFVGAT